MVLLNHEKKKKRRFYCVVLHLNFKTNKLLLSGDQDLAILSSNTEKLLFNVNLKTTPYV